ncbi:zinc transport system substrate-binding protein [Peptoniphilus asaccharolyticus DSM 20463]|uniref:Zinc transport system substrate-binding protein n=1 Tax=Peptoniphilus asaccharolyticus DSM 20463 TaxID=573058 RepID=A0A1W1VG20_PEPAS|nr:metal ABC transporter substrate-binding protein [Peptoniphilus asaccharolyticus]MBL7575861.1 zinc ABC transporter substrate-binding protein [Peptoniphilus asaccharolyticus]SMB92266.1 zinc transport system substrate-binding protein [Peptoniphilus asaccharolyticus DSM 20463]
MKKIKHLLVAMALVVLAACSNKNVAGDKQVEDASGKIKVYASVYPVYDFVNKIGGDKIELKSVIPNGEEPHGWEPDQQLLKDLEGADVFVYSGAGLESWVDKVTESVKNENLKIVEATEGVDLIANTHHHDEEHEAAEHNHNHDNEHEAAEHNHEHNEHHNEAAEHEHAHEHEHDHGAYDPHVWLSPTRAIKELENITTALSEADPANADYYKENLAKYSEEFKQLDADYKAKLAEVPNKTIVVSHEAYGYLVADYGLEQFGITGIEAETEPDAKTMKEIIQLVKEKNINTIFTEELLDTKIADTISSETGAKTVRLNPLEGLSEEEIKNGDEYVSVMRANLEKLVEALS